MIPIDIIELLSMEIKSDEDRKDIHKKSRERLIQSGLLVNSNQITVKGEKMIKMFVETPLPRMIYIDPREDES